MNALTICCALGCASVAVPASGAPAEGVTVTTDVIIIVLGWTMTASSGSSNASAIFLAKTDAGPPDPLTTFSNITPSLASTKTSVTTEVTCSSRGALACPKGCASAFWRRRLLAVTLHSNLPSQSSGWSSAAASFGSIELGTCTGYEP